MEDVTAEHVFVHAEQIPGPLLATTAVLKLLPKRPEWSKCRNSMTLQHETKYWCVFRVDCRESSSCSLRWLAIYYKKRAGHAPKTLVIMARGTHDHAGGKASGKIWTPHQLCLAQAFAATGPVSARALTAYLQSHGYMASDLPSPIQQQHWLKREKKKQKRMVQPGSQGTVEPARVAISDWVRDLQASVPDLCVLPEHVITGESVFVPFLCKGMACTVQRYTAPRVHLAIDAKMKVLSRGMGIATVSLLVKDGLRNATFARGFAGQVRATRVQGRAFTTRAMPIFQAIIDAETTQNFARLLAHTESLWRQLRPHDPSLRVILRQLHKDFVPGLEAARVDCMPHARPCDDYFHLRQKESGISTRCKVVELQNGRMIKTHHAWIMAVLDSVRRAPSLTFSLPSGPAS